MDFSKVKSLTIPEGAVKQITDAAGNVLWKSAPSTVKVTLLADTFESYDYCSAYIHYTTPEGEWVDLETAGEYEIPIGTLLYFELRFSGKDRASLYIYLNDEAVSSGEGEAFYDVTLTTNLSIEPVNQYYNGGEIYITEE